jgi:DNA-binding response OmpR family regulator
MQSLTLDRFASSGCRSVDGNISIHLVRFVDGGEYAAAIETAMRAARGRDLPRKHGRAIPTVYLFAGWTVEEMARNLVSHRGRRVDLTSSELELLMPFLRQPGQALSRTALLGMLRGCEWAYCDRSTR